MYVHTCTYIHVHTCVYMYIHVHRCMYMYIYIYIHVQIHTRIHIFTARWRSRSRSGSVPKSLKARKNRARRARNKALLQQAKKTVQNQSPKPKLDQGTKRFSKDERVPAREWQQITSFKYSGPHSCPFFNFSLGCRFGDQCKMKHSCVECGKDHAWHGNY